MAVKTLVCWNSETEALAVTFLLLVRPVILRLQGARQLAPRGYQLRADFDWPRPDKRRAVSAAAVPPSLPVATRPDR